MADAPHSRGFSTLLLQGLSHYRRGELAEAMKAWEGAYHSEPPNSESREFLRTALLRLNIELGREQGRAHPWLQPPAESPSAPRQQAAPAAAKAQPRKPQPREPQGAATPVDDGGADTILAPPTARPPSPETARPIGAMRPAMRVPPSRAPLRALPTPTAVAPAARSETPPATPKAAVAEVDAPTAWVEGPPAAAGHAAPPQAAEAAAPAPDAPRVLLRAARERLSHRDLGGALELAARVLQQQPGQPEATLIAQACETGLTGLYAQAASGLSGQPKLLVPAEKMLALSLDSSAGFVLSQIDGNLTYDELIDICGLPRAETARILAQLLRDGIIGTGGAG